jgi:hypothetical protein
VGRPPSLPDCSESGQLRNPKQVEDVLEFVALESLPEEL